MKPRAVAALGIGQLVNWGVLYYAFAVLVLPIQHQFGVATWVVTGAFSLALLMSALLAPAVGRLADRDYGPLVMLVGGFAAAVLLTLWAAFPSVPILYLTWAALGLCMGATLYEPAFVIIGRAYGDAASRLRALAAVTLFGGLASTLFLPITAFLVGTLEWRRAVVVLAGVLAGSTALTHVAAFRGLTARTSFDTAPSTNFPAALPGTITTGSFVLVLTMFAASSFASAAFVTNLVPALSERGVSPATAAILGGLIGLMQLPGRALLMHGMLAGSPSRLLTLSLSCQACGLGVVALGASTISIAAGTMIFALGSGLTTLVRPHLVQTMFGIGSVGFLNGRVARYQQLARAAGPLVVASVAAAVSYRAVFGAIAVAFAIVAVTSESVLTRLISRELQKETS